MEFHTGSKLGFRGYSGVVKLRERNVNSVAIQRRRSSAINSSMKFAFNQSEVFMV